MKLIRVFGLGLGLGYLIWSGKGREVLQQIQRGPRVAESLPAST